MKSKISPQNKPRPKGLILFLALICLNLFITSCDKYKQACCTCEVPYSETGAGTMGCMMDGEPWAVCDVANEIIPYSVSTNIETFNWYNIRVEKIYSTGRELIKLSIRNPHQGILPYKSFDSLNSAAWVYGEFSSKTNGKKGIFALDTASYAKFEITRFDTINRIISGRFECTLIENDGGVDTTTIKVTNGVFDTKY